MRFWTLIANGIRYHRRLCLGLLAGTIIACAALTGALAVGDSVRQTLRGIAEARLGRVGHALDWGNRYFDAALAGDHAAVLALRGMAEPPPERRGDIPVPHNNRLNRAWIYGVDDAFRWLAPEPKNMPMPGPQEALINTETARALGLQAGDMMTLRLARPSTMPLEAPLSRSGDNDIAVARVRVKAVLTDAQWGRFSLSTDQAMPANIFVDRTWLSDLLDMTRKANVMLAADTVTGEQLQDWMSSVWQPEQAGFRFREHPSGIVQLESNRLFLEDAVVQAAQRIGNGQPVLTYLVNSIAAGDRATPYSFVTAGVAPEGAPEDAVCVNQWLADMLDVQAGDRVTITWSEPLPSGEFLERSAEAPIHRVIPMEALQVERDLAPAFPGLSDVDTCRDWDIGLPLDDEKLQDKDNEAYWNEYGQTPKLLTTFETGRRWWGTRFGAVMAVRFTQKQGLTQASDQRERDGSVPVFVDDGAASDQRERDGSVPVFAQALRDTLDPAAIGLAFQPVCEEAERAVDQAMDFGALFIGMSMFLIASALALLTLLYAHGLQTRTGEMGALLAVGWPPRRVGAWLLFESLPIILAGIFVGTLCGVGYARMLLYGLVKFWPDAVAGTPLRFHVTLPTLALGAAIATMCVLAVLLTCVTRACRRPARELLQRDFASTATLSRGRRLPGALFGAVMLLATLLSVYQAFYGAADNPTIWFFASGAAALATALTAYALLLGWWTRRRAPAHPTLWRLILMQLARRRSRSLGVAVVTGCGVFMIISVTAMQAAMNFDVERPESGAGGFSVFASTTTPVRSSEETLLGLPRDSGVPLRVWDGDDAGCLNLNRAIRPRLYAVEPQALIARNAFAPPDEVKALWALLNLSLDDGVVPALVGDSDTAMWGLQAAADPERGAEFAYPGDTGETFRVRAVGKLPMRLSLFQGAMLISEENFTRMFPHEAGYRAFLIRADDAQATAAQLNRDHGRLGMEAIPSEERLRAFYAVERAYLAMFLVLGGIGMMLGAGGASVVALRNLAERRAEFALLLAVGYEPHLVRRMALIENAFLVTTGILFGVAAAALAITPLMLQAQHAAGLPALVAMLLGVITAYLAAVLITTRVALAEIPLAALRTE